MKRKIPIILVTTLISMSMSLNALATDYTNSDMIIRIQEALNEAGYDCGTPDGKPGQKTKDAVSKYREEHGLSAGEILDDDLAASLGISDESTTETSVAEEWECPNCGSVETGNFCSNCGTEKPSKEWVCPNCGAIVEGNFCGNCGTAKSESDNENIDATVNETEEAVSQEGNNITDHIKDYTGLNLASVGYTSMGGDRRDYYAESNIILAIVTPDGIYVDPDDEEQLQSYTVVSQMPAAGNEIVFTYDDEENELNCSYSEIVLAVQKADDLSDAPQLTEIMPSTNKETQFMKDYVGRNLATIGYTAMNGNRYDTFGSDDQRIQISILDESGMPVDLGSNETLKYYTVTSQSLEPNSELGFTYSKDSDGELEITAQTVSTIQITAKMSEEGAAALEQNAAEEEELRASGNLTELYEGTYKVGENLDPGNYKFKELNDSVSIYTYRDEDALNSDDGEWDFIHGSDDVVYIAMKEGMYLKVGDGAVKAIRSDFYVGDEPEIELYEGVYRVGTDIVAGSYEMSHISESCNVHIYQTEKEFEAEDGDWDFLYGKDDKGYYSLQDGMILEITDGAVKAVRNG